MHGIFSLKGRIYIFFLKNNFKRLLDLLLHHRAELIHSVNFFPLLL